jgi:hypothetical protein
LAKTDVEKLIESVKARSVPYKSNKKSYEDAEKKDLRGMRRESKSVLPDWLAYLCHIRLPNSNMLLQQLQRRCHHPPFSTSRLACI